MCDRHRQETHAARNGAVPPAAGPVPAISGLGPNSLGAMGIGEGAAAKSIQRVPTRATILGKSGPPPSRPRPEPTPDQNVPQVLNRDSLFLRFLGYLLFWIRTSRRSGVGTLGMGQSHRPRRCGGDRRGLSKLGGSSQDPVVKLTPMGHPAHDRTIPSERSKNRITDFDLPFFSLKRRKPIADAAGMAYKCITIVTDPLQHDITLRLISPIFLSSGASPLREALDERLRQEYLQGPHLLVNQVISVR